MTKTTIHLFLTLSGAILAGCAGAAGDDEGLDLAGVGGDPLELGSDDASEGVDGAYLDESLDEEATFVEADGAAGGELGTARQALGGACGSTTGVLNSVFALTVVPSHFPPDSGVAVTLSLALAPACVPFGVASMDATCVGHDRCYGELGRSKESCDDEALDGWIRACRSTYDDFSFTDGLLTFVFPPAGSAEAVEAGCRRACEAQAELMFQAIDKAGDSAYEHAQEEASRPRLGAPTGPIFEP